MPGRIEPSSLAVALEPLPRVGPRPGTLPIAPPSTITDPIENMPEPIPDDPIEVTIPVGPHRLIINNASKVGTLDGEIINEVQFETRRGTAFYRIDGSEWKVFDGSSLYMQLAQKPTKAEIAAKPLSTPSEVESGLAQVGMFVPPTRTELDQDQITTNRHNMEEPQSFLSRYGLLLLIGAGALLWNGMSNATTVKKGNARSGRVSDIADLKADVRAIQKQEEVLEAQKDELQNEIIDEV